MFGSNGVTLVDFGGTDEGRSVAIQANGRMVVAGFSHGSQVVMAVTKLGPLGKRVGNFGVSGKVTMLVGSRTLASSVAIQSNGKIVVAGDATTASPGDDFVLVRYNSDGSLDNSFGVSGIATTDFGGTDYSAAVVIQPNGQIVIAGYSLNGRIRLARYNGDPPVSLTANAENISAATDKKLLALSTIKIFPNPAKDILGIDGMDASSTKTISIVDMNGRVVQTTTTGNSTHTWNIASLPAGTYYLLIDNKKKKTSLKFVKE